MQNRHKKKYFVFLLTLQHLNNLLKLKSSIKQVLSTARHRQTDNRPPDLCSTPDRPQQADIYLYGGIDTRATFAPPQATKQTASRAVWCRSPAPLMTRQDRQRPPHTRPPAHQTPTTAREERGQAQRYKAVDPNRTPTGGRTARHRYR